ncbi:hypothetical protein CAPTEDRAFT_185120 [Capitella teleta]|uniref:Uncharacterized protein n=1 Tax=Capitella teleta TaxID=283909 RepID=R7UFX2_CAPTE|nr:hypothetical protein CAPTEDRAFT_185120 [Capitella teleta]|eukprot:ELU02187.1 hypothetical protein CAPTEDRAFT_185120 [Capitella teleta]
MRKLGDMLLFEAAVSESCIHHEHSGHHVAIPSEMAIGPLVAEAAHKISGHDIFAFGYGFLKLTGRYQSSFFPSGSLILDSVACMFIIAIRRDTSAKPKLVSQIED